MKDLSLDLLLGFLELRNGVKLLRVSQDSLAQDTVPNKPDLLLREVELLGVPRDAVLPASLQHRPHGLVVLREAHRGSQEVINNLFHGFDACQSLVSPQVLGVAQCNVSHRRPAVDEPPVR
jgi:hypothetical protein